MKKSSQVMSLVNDDGEPAERDKGRPSDLGELVSAISTQGYWDSQFYTDPCREPAPYFQRIDQYPASTIINDSSYAAHPLIPYMSFPSQSVPHSPSTVDQTIEDGVNCLKRFTQMYHSQNLSDFYNTEDTIKMESEASLEEAPSKHQISCALYEDDSSLYSHRQALNETLPVSANIPPVLKTQKNSHTNNNMDFCSNRNPAKENPVTMPWNEAPKRVQYRKTKLCPWYVKGKCWLKGHCNYAHNDAELQLPPDLTCTKICPQGASCNNANCRFAHRLDELRSTNVFFRTKLCKYWNSGVPCPSGIHCRHAHGLDQVRFVHRDTMETKKTYRISAMDAPLKTQNAAPSESPLHCTLNSPMDSQSLQNSGTLDSKTPDQLTLLTTDVYGLSSCAKGPQNFTKELMFTPFSDVFQQNTFPYVSPSSEIPCCPSSPVVHDSILASNILTNHAETTSTDYDDVSLDSNPLHSMYTLTGDTHGESSLVSPKPLPYKNHVADASMSVDSIIKLSDILNLAVASCDPDLLESSAHIFRASLKLRTLRQQNEHGYLRKGFLQNGYPVCV